MAKSKSVVRDFLVKILKVFPTDMYIINNRYCIQGKISDVDLNYHGLCVLEENIVEALGEFFKKEDIIYIPDIKTSKVKFDDDKFLDTVSIIDNDKDKKDVLDILTDCLQMQKVESWDNLSLEPFQIERIYNKNQAIKVFEDKEDIPSLIIGKDTFPLITEKTIDTVLYHIISYDKKFDLVNICLMYVINKYFTIYMKFSYLDLDNKESN